jgi:hypothetical protein
MPKREVFVSEYDCWAADSVEVGHMRNLFGE